jgi:uncharacterized protein
MLRKLVLVPILAALAVVGLLHAAVAQDATGVDPARVAAAKELMNETGVTKQMDSMVAVMGEGFRKGARDAGGGAVADQMGDEFDVRMKRLLSYRDAMVEEFAIVYAQRFTVDELKAVTEFYKSPTGQKFIQASPELMQAGAAIGIKYSQKVLQPTTDKNK